MAAKKRVAKKKAKKKKEVVLTPKQRLFVAEYLVDLNATQAAIRAGYSKKTAKSQGQRLLTNVDVAAAIQKAFEDRIERTEIDADYVLKMTDELLKRCMQHTPALDQNGDPTGEYKFDSAGAARALKLLGDHSTVSAFKAVDGDGVPIDLHWLVTVVHTRAEAEKLIPPDPNPDLSK